MTCGKHRKEESYAQRVSGIHVSEMRLLSIREDKYELYVCYGTHTLSRLLLTQIGPHFGGNHRSLPRHTNEKGAS